MFEFKRVKGSYGKPWADKINVPVTRELLNKVGECLVGVFAKEALKDFAKRGWSVRDPMKGPDIGKSFSYRISGNSTVEVISTFYGMDVLTKGAIPEHRMPWLTQQAQGIVKKPEGKKPVLGARHASPNRKKQDRSMITACFPKEVLALTSIAGPC